MTFIPFDLERWQSTWEHRVRYNLSESGVHPLSLAELMEVTETDVETVNALRLGYSQTNGSDELRTAIASLYSGVPPDNVLVTIGGSEANFLACTTLLSSVSRVCVQLPNYLQSWGIAHNIGAVGVTFSRHPELGWEPDLDELRSAIRADTTLVVITHPNNPTGHVLSSGARKAVMDRVQETGAWLLVDEIYQGAEVTGETTASWLGDYDRTIITNGLSKAYGLPGLRIGWMIAPPEFIARAEQRHDYAVICPSALSDFLATRALSAPGRSRLLERTRRIIRDNYSILESWLTAQGDLFAWEKPDAGAICLTRYHLPIDSVPLVERLHSGYDVLLVPGAHVGMDKYLRIGCGGPKDHLVEGLAALERGMKGIESELLLEQAARTGQ